MRFLVLTWPMLARAIDLALRFVTPAPFCTAQTLAHAGRVFGVKHSLRVLFLNNIASVLATALSPSGLWG